MKSNKARVVSIVLIVMMVISILGGSISALAASTGQSEIIQNYLNTSDKYSSSIIGSFKKSSDPNDSSYSDSNVWEMYTGKDSGYYYYLEISRRSAVEDAINRKSNNGQVEEDVRKISSTLDVGADVETAGVLLSGFVPILSTLLGLMVTLISIGMTVFSAFDLCFIAFPVFRNKCEDAKASGNNIMTKKGSGGETKLRFVSDDAQYAVQAADTVQSGKNPFVIYFQKRLLSYIILAILLFILLTGNITVFTNIALKVVSGILEVIGTF